jgi:hypothetical protein
MMRTASIWPGAAALCLGGTLAATGCAPAPEPRVVDARFFGVPFVQDHEGRWFVVDTGSPRTLVAPAVAGVGGAGVTEAVLPGWQVAGLDTGSVPVVVAELDFLADRGALSLEPFGGLVGADLLQREDVVAFDHRGGRIAFQATERVLEPPRPAAMATRFEVLGAGSTCIDGACFDYPASRIVVPVEIEGVTTHAVVDTGATFTVALHTLVARLPARADRPRAAVGGTTFTRTAVLALGKAGDHPGVANTIVIESRADEVFAKLQIETGRRVELILGHSFLADHVTEIDHGQGVLALYPYPGGENPFESWFVSVGLTLRQGDACFDVVEVAAGSDAETHGLVPGDCVVAVDGMRAADTPLDAVLEHVRALALGTRIPVELRRDGATSTLALSVHTLLPPMAIPR